MLVVVVVVVVVVVIVVVGGGGGGVVVAERCLMFLLWAFFLGVFRILSRRDPLLTTTKSGCARVLAGGLDCR